MAAACTQARRPACFTRRLQFKPNSDLTSHLQLDEQALHPIELLYVLTAFEQLGVDAAAALHKEVCRTAARNRNGGNGLSTVSVFMSFDSLATPAVWPMCRSCAVGV